MMARCGCSDLAIDHCEEDGGCARCPCREYVPAPGLSLARIGYALLSAALAVLIMLMVVGPAMLGWLLAGAVASLIIAWRLRRRAARR